MEIKNLTIFGGSGNTGKVLIRHAIERGAKVKALVRNPTALGNNFEKAEILEGSILNPNDVDKSLKNSDAVICVFGQRPPYKDIFCEEATEIIINSMKKNNVDRLVCQTGGMIGDYPENRTFFFRKMTSIFNERLSSVAQDRVAQEKAVIYSELNWTIVKPPRLTDKKSKGTIIAGKDIRLGSLSSITTDDLSEFLLNTSLSDNFSREYVFIKN